MGGCRMSWLAHSSCPPDSTQCNTYQGSTSALPDVRIKLWEDAVCPGLHIPSVLQIPHSVTHTRVALVHCLMSGSNYGRMPYVMASTFLLSGLFGVSYIIACVLQLGQSDSFDLLNAVVEYWNYSYVLERNQFFSHNMLFCLSAC